MHDLRLRRAEDRDVASIAACVQHAYARYEGLLPRPPKPVLADYAQVVRDTLTWLIEADGQCLGVLVLIPRADHLLLDNVAVEPAFQGRGLGHRLLNLAEAEALRLGLAEVRLYTNALMTENRALYARAGYQEYDRRDVDGRDAVFMRKTL
jgi:N-acetylglutamate synthase-like GNAT family acetyltransferase